MQRAARGDVYRYRNRSAAALRGVRVVMVVVTMVVSLRRAALAEQVLQQTGKRILPARRVAGAQRLQQCIEVLTDFFGGRVH